MHSKHIDPKKPDENSGAASKHPRSPSRFPFAAVIVVVLIFAGVVSGLIPRWNRHAQLNAKTLAPSVPSVAVVSPTPGKPGKGLSLPAEIKPIAEAPIYARANGYLKQRLVDIGAHVTAGQLLAEIDTPEINQDLERARAQLAQAEASLELSKITATRWALLLKTASVSEQEAAEKQADLKLKTANAAATRADVRRLEKLQSFSRVTAPFSGVITVRNIDAGDLIVAAGGKELFHLAQTEKLRVYVQIPQEMARNISAGQSAELTLPELPGHTFTAKVIRTAGVITADSRTLLVELEMDNSKDNLLAGGYAQVRFPDLKMEAGLILPANTVLFSTDGPQVGVVLPDNKVELRSVKIGRNYGQNVEIISGLNPKNRVIVNPVDSLTSGVVVSIAEPVKSEKSQ